MMEISRLKAMNSPSATSGLDFQRWSN